jgi:hypothetical protein
LTLPNPVLRGSAPLPAPALADELERILDAVEAEARDLPRDTFEPQAVVERVGRDVDALFAFVRDQTWWVPYDGSLRGATGVLMDRVGNSLDRALCLATLLRAAGHEARLAHAELPEARARELAPTLPQLPDGRVPSRKAAANVELAQAVAGRVTEQTATLRALLGERTARDAAGEPWRALREHWWVQVPGAGEAWQDLDPLQPEARPGDRIVAASAVVEHGDDGFGVPRASWHRLEVVVRVESLVQGRLEQRVALRHELLPAELLGEPIALWFHPMDWPDDGKLVRDAEPMRRFREACLAQQEWLPTLRIGERIVSQSSFRRDGTVDDRPVVDPMKRLGKGVGGALGGALDALSGAETTPAVGALTAVFVEYAIHAPGRAPEVHRRATFDLLGTRRDAEAIRAFAADEAQQLVRALALRSRTNVLPLCCQPSPEFVLATAAAQTRANRAQIRAASAAANDPDPMKFATAFQRLRPVPGMLPMLALARTALSRVAQDLYVDRLQLLCEEAGFAATADGSVVARVGFDIVANRFAVRPTADAFAVAFEQGVVDTTVEAMLRDRGAPTWNTGELLAVSPAQDVAWRRVAQVDDLDGLAIDAEVRASLAAELDAGHVLIVPERSIELAGRQLYGWWRIDPVTGQALGVMDSGRGQAMVEYGLILLTGVTAFFGCAGANPGGNSGTKNAACFACAALAAFAAAVVLGVIAGGTLGALLGGSAGLPVFGACNMISAFAS